MGATYAGGSGTSAAIPVPAGMAANELALVFLYVETDAAITLPTGFTQAALAENNMVTKEHRLYLSWKRATGADTGTYTFSWTGSAWRSGYAMRVSGAITTGDPFDTGTGATVTGVTTLVDTVPPALSLTTTQADTLLVYGAVGYDGPNTWTPPTGMTERADAENQLAATLAQAAAAGTGNLQGTYSAATALSAFLGAVLSPVTAAGAAPPFLPPVHRLRHNLVR